MFLQKVGLAKEPEIEVEGNMKMLHCKQKVAT